MELKGKLKNIPRNIYLTSHFTRVDVPGFSDLRIWVWEEKLNVKFKKYICKFETGCRC